MYVYIYTMFLDMSNRDIWKYSVKLLKTWPDLLVHWVRITIFVGSDPHPFRCVQKRVLPQIYLLRHSHQTSSNSRKNHGQVVQKLMSMTPADALAQVLAFPIWLVQVRVSRQMHGARKALVGLGRDFGSHRWQMRIFWGTNGQKTSALTLYPFFEFMILKHSSILWPNKVCDFLWGCYRACNQNWANMK